MEQHDQPEKVAPRGGNALSNVFAVLAVVFAVVAIALYFRGSGGGSGIAPIPTAPPGGNQIVNVTEALKAQGLTVEQPPGRFIPRGAVDVPGQGVEIDGNPGFIFLFPDAASAQGNAADVTADDVVPERIAGQPAPDGARRLTQGSNVIVLLVGGHDETWQKVQDAVASLS